MADNADNLNQLESSELDGARGSIEAAQIAATGATKTAMIWAATLAIVWFTGLEPMLRTAIRTTTTFQEINSRRQEIDRIAFALARSAGEKEALIRRLERWEKKYPSEESRRDERQRLQKVRDQAESMNEVKNAEANLKEWNQFESDIRTLPMLRQQLESSESPLREEQARVKSAHEELKKQARDQREVSFEFLGFNFSVSALPATIVWNLLVLGLLAYLVWAQEKSAGMTEEGLQTFSRWSRLDATTRQKFASRMPLLLSRAVLLKKRVDDTSLPNESSTSRATADRVLDQSEKKTATDSFAILIAVGVLAQFRVAWLALEMSRYLGTTLLRAALPFVLVVLLSLTIWLSERLLFGRLQRPLPTLSTKALFYCGTAILFFGAACWGQVQPFMFLSSFLCRSFWNVIILTGLVSAVIFVPWGLFAEASNKVKQFAPIGMTRRNLLVGSFALFVMLAVPSGYFLFRRRRGRRRKRYGLVKLPPGFYQRREVHCPACNYTSVGSVYHYVANGGRVSMRRQFPTAPQEVKQSLQLLQQSFNNEFEELPVSIKQGMGDKLNNEDYRTISIGQREGRVLSSLVRRTRKLATYLFPIDLVLHIISPIETDSNDEKSNEGSENEISHEPAFAPTNWRSTKPVPRVNLATASWALETSALSTLTKQGSSKKSAVSACNLLFLGIEHDLILRRRANQGRKQARASYRLYDLLAGISVRFRHDVAMEKMNDIINKQMSASQRLGFQSRLDKWHDAGSNWRKKWKNRNRIIAWKTDLGVFVF